jgi:aryl-phospho-beta-D-glucosidase BglC (GH1 family)
VSQTFLKTQGTNIVDSQGNVVILRGADFFGYEFGVGIPEAWDTHAESDYVRMASWAFNVVRLPIAWSLIEAREGTYDQNYMGYVDRDISWAKANGLYVVIDMHDYGWSPYFTYFDSWHTAGVPTWAVSIYPNSAAGEAHARADFYNGLGPNGTAASATNPSLQERFLNVWKFVANRYRSEPAVAGYDMLNEPTVCAKDDTSCDLDSSVFVSQTLPAFYQKVASAIRSVDSRHILFFEPSIVPLSWNNPSQFVQLMSGSKYGRIANSVYSPHYPGIGDSGYTGASYNGNKASIDSALQRDVLSLSKQWKVPVFVGEWGLRVDGTNASQYTHDFTDLEDKYLISGAWYTYGYCSYGLCLFDDNGNQRTAITQYLIRPRLYVYSAPITSSQLALSVNQFQTFLSGSGIVRVYFPSTDSSPTVVSSNVKISSSYDKGILTVSVPSSVSELVVALQ